MKVLLIGPLPPPVGGTTASFAHLTEDLKNLPGIQTCVLPTLASNKRTFKSHALAPLKMLLDLFRAIPKHDVITFHASTRRLVYFGPILLFLCRLLGRPLILRGFGGSLDLAYSRGSPIQRLMIQMLFRADRVLLQTKKLIDFFQPLFPSAKLTWFPNSRPLPKISTVNARKSNDSKRFIFLSIVKPSKGIREILDAAEQLKALPFSVDVYGPLDEGLTESEFSTNSKVTYKGVVNHWEAIPLLANYDALLLPSYYEGEGYPGIILEAYMAGIPVITTNWRTIPEIVEDRRSGILIPPRDSKALAEAMQELIEDSELLANLKQGAREFGKGFSSEYWHQQVFVELCYDLITPKTAKNREPHHESP